MSQPVANNPAIAGKDVFALIIGIDEYKKKDAFNTLEGAVNDAKAFRDFLVDSNEKSGLGVPESNILLLCNGQATREEILGKFKTHLLNNPDIPNGGDAVIIFFFAGHGTRISASKNWISQDRKVEGICPVDERTIFDGKYVHTIPDYVLVHLLQQLSEKKGRNITAIFDSCHSAGMGRDVGGRARTANSPAPSPRDDIHYDGDIGNLGSDLFTENGPDTSNGLQVDSATHVWLAACSIKEAAREVLIDAEGQWHGRFTYSLIKKLRQVDLGNTTYVELMQRLESSPTQTPCCGGQRRNLLLFASKYPKTGRSAMPLFIHRKFRVAVGKPAVDVGTEFRVLDQDNRTVCTLVAQKVTAEDAILELDPKVNTKVVLPENARAAPKGWSGVLVTEITQRMFRVAMGELAGVVVDMEFLVLDGNDNEVCTLVAQEVKVEETILVLRPSANQEVVLPENARVASTRWDAMPVAEITRKFRVSMGELAGIVRGTELRVVDWKNHPVCTLVAYEVRPESTILVLHPKQSPEVVIPENARVVVSDWKNDKMILRVFVPPDFPYLEALFPARSQSNSSDRAFVREPCKNDAHIGLSMSEDANLKDMVVERVPVIFKYEPKVRFPLPREPALRLPNALGGIAHFNYFLEHHLERVPFNTGTVSLKVHRLKGERPTREPDFALGDLVKNDQVLLTWDPDANYGIIIRNTTEYKLFPYLFAFDATEYTINLLYEPHDTEAPLKSNPGEVTVGMGGQQAFKFGPLPLGVERSSAFLKLFVATKPTDLAWIEQTISPFDDRFEGRPRFGVGKEAPLDTWHAFVITMTMTKS